MNLKNVVQSELDKVIDSGKVQEIISKEIEKTIQGILHDTLREYSDFGNSMREVVKQCLKIDLSKLSLLNYQLIVTDIVKEQLEKAMLQHVSEPMEKVLSEVIGEFESRTYKLSEIIEMYKKHRVEEESGELSFHIERTNYNSIHVSFDKDSNKERYNCEVTFSIDTKDKKIYSFDLKGWRPKHGDLRASSIHGSFDHFLLNIYASQCPIEIDEHACETEWYNDYD